MAKIRFAGQGLYCSLGRNPEEVYQRMCAGEDAFRPVWRFPADPYKQQKAGMLSAAEDEFLRNAYPDDELAGALAKQAGRQALGLPEGAPARPDGGLTLVLASNFGAWETQEWLWREKQDFGTVSLASQEHWEDFLPGLARSLGCAGGCQQLSFSCASGTAALAAGWDIIRAGRAERVLVIAFDILGEFCWCGLHNLHTITSDTMRPFDRRRSGTIFSEGAAAVLLEREGDRAASAAPAQYLIGAATNNNAYHLTAPRPEAEGSREVIQEALRQSGLAAADIEHICAHATSTVANDKTEAAALRNIFGDHLSGLTVAAHKSQLGHLLGAAGLAEAIITLLAMRHGVIPPTLNLQEIDPDCAFLDCLAGPPRRKNFSTALVNSAGIGGNNAAVILTQTQA